LLVFMGNLALKPMNCIPLSSSGNCFYSKNLNCSKGLVTCNKQTATRKQSFVFSMNNNYQLYGVGHQLTRRVL
jgi:hypothetical protein